MAEEKLLVLAQSVYQPWIPYVKQYSKLESENLRRQLSSSLVCLEDLAENVQTLGLSVTSAVATASGAQQRCLQLSHGYAFIGLLKAIKVRCSIILFYLFPLVRDFNGRLALV